MPIPAQRSGAHKGGLALPRALKIPCPKCGAAIGWGCVAVSVDADGKRFARYRLKTIHQERRTPRGKKTDD